MSRASVYEVWKGSEHPWVKWVKPALFAAVDDEPVKPAQEAAYRGDTAPWAGLDTAWLPEHAAVIIDLPGPRAVSLGLALGQRGVRPVLCINTCSEFQELIKMEPVVELLSLGARFPTCFPNGPMMAPAFILDSRRAGEGKKAPPGCFDNRWAVFRADLPPAPDLLAVGVRRVVIVQHGSRPLGDLEAVLRAYQASGLELLAHDPVTPNGTSVMSVQARGWFDELADGIQRRFQFRRRWDGSFGRRVPIPPEPSHG